MNKQKLQKFIADLQAMATELDESSNQLGVINEPVNEQPLAVSTATTTSTTTSSVEPYYKSYSLPNNITFSRDIISDKVVYNFGYGLAEGTGIGIQLSHVYITGNTGQSFGALITPNLDELILTDSAGNTYYEDSNRDKYYADEYGKYKKMTLTDEAPVEVTNVYTFPSSYGFVKFLTDGNITRCFNSAGRLVMIIDSHRQNLLIGRDANNKITNIYDRFNQKTLHKYTFIYGETSTDRLDRITRSDNSGANVITVASFTYTGSTLTGFTNLFGTATITYSGLVLTSIESSLGYKISYASNKLEVRSTRSAIPGSASSTELKAISSWTFDRTSNATLIDDVDRNKDIYIFGNGKLTGHYTEECGVITQAEKYVYESDRIKTYYKAKKSSLNKYNYLDFTFDFGDMVSNTYNTNGQLSRTTEIKVQKDTEEKYDTVYYYKDLKLTSEIKNITYGAETSPRYKMYKLYFYDDSNQMFKKEEFEFGERDTLGKQAVEYEYDTSGNIIKTYSYNSLEPTKQYVTETTYDIYGRVLTKKDERGKTYYYAYNGYSRRVSQVTSPDGNVISYEYDDSGRLTRLSTTDDAGNAVKNDVVYQYDEMTQASDTENTAHKINYKYDEERRLKQVLFGTSNHQQYSYADDTTTKTIQCTNANTEVRKAILQKDGKNSKLYYGSVLELEQQYTLTFTSEDVYTNKMTRTDGITGEIETFNYMLYDTLSSYTSTKNNYSETYSYLDTGEVGTVTLKVNNVVSGTYTFTYTSNYRVPYTTTYTCSNGSAKFVYTTDKQIRNTGKTSYVNNAVVQTESISYTEMVDGTVVRQTNLPSSIIYTNGSGAQTQSIAYSYDDVGNIETINVDGNVTTYVYDKLYRLKRENNKALGKTYVYTYDTQGNILTKTTYAYTTATTPTNGTTVIYTYSGIKLMQYNGIACNYDAAGNPTTYRGNQATWKGRQMLSYNGNTFSYDGKGRRISKNTITYTYDSSDRLIKSSNGLEFFYDNTGVAGVVYNGAVYVYRKDVQGNINAILDSNGVVVVQYIYDAWGNHTVSGSNTTLGNLNPFRYRGYFYDTETGFYYLKTRYYDPEVGRFLNMDSIAYADPESLGGLNLYAYCNNNPVMYSDPTGHSWESFWNGVGDWLVKNGDIVVGVAITVGLAAISIATFGIATVATGMIVGAVVGAGFGALNAYVNNDNVLYGAISGMISGALSGVGGPGIGGMILSGLTSAAGAATLSLIGDRVNGRERNFEKAGVSALTAGVFAFLGSGASNLFTKEQLSVQIVGGFESAFIFTSYTFISDFIYDRWL